MTKLLFLLFSGVKLSKLLLSGGTMLLSVLLYAWVYGWRYAVGFIALLFVHEMGHYLAARQKGLNVGLPTFIPFVGAWIELKEMPHDAQTEAYVGLGGPLLGTVGATVCYLMARSWNLDWLLAVSYAGFFLNLFNLIPISPLDGGRITAIISPKVWLAGVPLLAGLFFFRPSPMLILIALLAWPQLKAAFTGQSDHAPGYYAASLDARINYAVMYLGLAAFLAIMSYEIHAMLGG